MKSLLRHLLRGTVIAICLLVGDSLIGIAGLVIVGSMIDHSPPKAPAKVAAPERNTSHRYAGKPGGGTVIIWRNEEALDTGMKLLRVDADSALIFPLIACIVPGGTEIVTSGMSWLTKPVTVIKGKNTGCKGVMLFEHLAVSD